MNTYKIKCSSQKTVELTIHIHHYSYLGFKIMLLRRVQFANQKATSGNFGAYLWRSPHLQVQTCSSGDSSGNYSVCNYKGSHDVVGKINVEPINLPSFRKMDNIGLSRKQYTSTHYASALSPSLAIDDRFFPTAGIVNFEDGKEAYKVE